MAGQKFMTLVSGVRTLLSAIQTTAGAGDAGKILAANAAGKLDESFLPDGIGASVQIVSASEALVAGDFVNLWNDSGTLKARKADATNGRAAHGFVKVSVASSADASMYWLDGTNTELSGLTVGARYYLGAAGVATSVPYDPTNPANAGYYHQYLGLAVSATELATEDSPIVVL